MIWNICNLTRLFKYRHSPRFYAIVQEEFKQILLTDATTFEEDVSSLMRRFKDTGPFTSDWDAKGKLLYVFSSV